MSFLLSRIISAYLYWHSVHFFDSWPKICWLYYNIDNYFLNVPGLLSKFDRMLLRFSANTLVTFMTFSPGLLIQSKVSETGARNSTASECGHRAINFDPHRDSLKWRRLPQWRLRLNLNQKPECPRVGSVWTAVISLRELGECRASTNWQFHPSSRLRLGVLRTSSPRRPRPSRD